MKPGLIIFDCDGVLVDSEATMNRLLSEDLAGAGLTLSPEACLTEFKGGSMLDVPVYAANRGVVLAEDWVDAFYRRLYTLFEEEGVPVIEGIPALLNALDDAQIPYCVASNGSEEKMSVTLGQNGLWDRFKKACFSAHTYGAWKPDPALFLAAAKSFGVDPKDVLVIEDSTSGARAARAAGMRCLGYAAESDGAELAAEGAIVIHAIQDVYDYLGPRR